MFVTTAREVHCRVRPREGASGGIGRWSVRVRCPCYMGEVGSVMDACTEGETTEQRKESW